jgi:hypothetical protein
MTILLLIAKASKWFFTKASNSYREGKIMRTRPRTAIWFCLTGLTCLVLLSCQVSQLIPGLASPTPTPTDTPQPSPTDVPTDTPIPTNTPTDTPTPPPTATATPIPSPTVPPSPTEIPATHTPALSKVTVVSNLNQLINISLSGPENLSFQVQAHSKYEFETTPGRYAYRLQAKNFYDATGYVEFPPGPFTWTWGKAAP